MATREKEIILLSLLTRVHNYVLLLLLLLFFFFCTFQLLVGVALGECGS